METRMRALVINLDRSPQRLEWMQSQFDRLGLQFERVVAVDGRDLSSSELKIHANARLDGMIWTPSEIACFLSHRKCWQIIADGDAPYGAVFEDDIHVDAEVAALMHDDTWIPLGAELLKMEAPNEEFYQHSPSNSGKRHRLFKSGDNWVGSAGYVISQALAKRIAATEALNCTVDQFLFDNELEPRDFISYEIRPGICIQATVTQGYDGPLRSVIGEERQLPTPTKQHIRRSILVKILRELARPPKRIYRRVSRKYREWRAPVVVFPAPNYRPGSGLSRDGLASSA